MVGIRHASPRLEDVGSGLEISFFAYRSLPYHLADGSIMNSQIIRILFQSISKGIFTDPDSR